MAPSGPDQPVVSLLAERERTIELLGQHFAHDNISMEELERLIEQAYRAPDVAALRALTRDLPSTQGELVARPAHPVRDAFVPEEGRLVSIMGQTRRHGVWQPPKLLTVVSVMSETTLDLTEAMLSPGVTEIHLRGLMASVKIIVPRGVRVVVQPSAFMADVNDETVDPPPVGSGAPVVRVTGWVMMTELKVVVRRRELPAEYDP